MNMKKRQKRKEEKNIIKEIKSNRIKREHWATIFNGIATFIFTGISLYFSFPFFKSFSKTPFKASIVIGIIGIAIIINVAVIIIQIFNYFKLKAFEEDYNYYSESKRVSTALLKAIKRTDFGKTCDILQSTYGSVPQWNPINYDENVLVYDIHQHIRNICIRLKELIVQLSPDFTDDMVTVDIVYYYPIDQKIKTGVFNSKKNTIKWKAITSGDHTSSDIILHNYLHDEHSFYSYLGEQGYVFCNDKKHLDKTHHYVWSSKDYEKERIGSIVGTVIDLKNDDPEIVFVKSYLTIATYGRKLVEPGDILDEKKFEQLFTDTVINSYKTLIETELAQMFIRHGIKSGYISRKTGKLKKIDEK